MFEFEILNQTCRYFENLINASLIGQRRTKRSYIINASINQNQVPDFVVLVVRACRRMIVYIQTI